jgi:hypothetical protein
MAEREAMRRRWALESEMVARIRSGVRARLAAEPELCAQVERGEVGTQEAAMLLMPPREAD